MKDATTTLSRARRSIELLRDEAMERGHYARSVALSDALDSIDDAITAHAHAGDHETSHRAARSVTGMSEKRSALLRCFMHAGIPMSDEQAAEAYESNRTAWAWPEQSASGLRTRRAELVQLGHLIDSGQLGVTDAGRPCILWRLAPAAASGTHQAATNNPQDTQ